MGLLDSDAGKKRLLSVEIPIIERYNHSRDPEFYAAGTWGPKAADEMLARRGHSWRKP